MPDARTASSRRPADAVVILHPLRRRAEAIAEISLAVGAACGLEVRIERTTPQRPGAQQAREAVAAGAQRVVAVGGDGTVRSVAAGLAGSGVPMGIIPTGTANLFALNLALRPRRGRRAPAADLHRALTGSPSAHDVGRLRWRDAEGREHHAVFLMVAGLGEDAAVVAETTEALKARVGWPAYLLRGAARLSAADHLIEIRVDAGAWTRLPAWSVLIGNAPRIPAGVRVFPGARTDSGRLQVLRAAPASAADWAGIAWHGATRRPQRAAGLHYEHAHRVELASSPLPLQADGDVLGRAIRVEARVDPAALLVAC